MTQIGHFLCLLLGCLIGHSIVYVGCKIWNFLTEKRVEIPEIKYDVADNPILQLKSRLGQAYVASHDQTVKKLLHKLLEYVEVIEEWHNAKVHLAETKCDTYRTKAARTEVELRIARANNEVLTKQLKDAELKNEQLRQMLKLNIGEPLITPQDWQNTYGKKPIPVGYFGTAKTATEATELAERLMNMTSKPIALDSETLNEPQISDEEFVTKLRDWWGLEASKAVELPNTDKKEEHRLTAEELRWKYLWTLLYSIPEGSPVKRFKVRVVGTYNNGRDMIHTDWELPATGINEIIDVLGKDGLRIIGGEELP